MNWEKCMKKMNCKVCEDYKFCKDDEEEEKKEKRTKRKKRLSQK